MSGFRAVVWSEGLFLQAQHFQQQERYLERRIHALTHARQPWGWGFLSYALDEAALAMGKVALASARGVLPDGTPFDLPGDGPLPPPLDIPADARDEIVFLALPLARPGAQSVDAEADPQLPAPAGLRHALGEVMVADATRADGEPVEVQVALPNLRLMLAREAGDGHATTGVVRVRERHPDHRVELDAAYIPAVLDVRASGPLHALLRELTGLLRQRGEALAARLNQPGAGGVSEVSDFLLLQTANRHEPLFNHLERVSLLHPERFYAAALALVGDLAVFRGNRRPPALAPYVHDDLQASFAELAAAIRAALSTVFEQSAVPIPLQDRNYGVRVGVIADLQLARSASFVLAVSAQMPGEALRTRFPTQVKAGPAERIRDLVNLQLPGVALRALPVAPRQIPFHAGFSYFELDRSSELWRQLERTGNLALHIAGDFPGLELECWAIRG